MRPSIAPNAANDAWDQRTRQLIVDQQAQLYRQTDQLIAGLLIFEFMAGIIAALWVSPFTWTGIERQLHPHVWSAIFFGLTIISLPVCLAVLYPARLLTRHVISIAQMMMTGLLIHLSGGRIETHFLVFGSLAFLAFYRDWRLLITASLVTAADHLIRGIVWPYSIYGVEAATSWRWIEHAGWVLFEDLFLVLSCLRSTHEMRSLAQRQSQLEATNAGIEDQVKLRTMELETSQKSLSAMNAQCVGILDAATQVSIIATNSHGLITVFNSGAENMLGYSAEEMVLRRTPLILHIPDELAERGRQLTEELGYEVSGFEVLVAHPRRGEYDRSEWTLVRKDGTHLIVNMVVTAVRTESGEIIGFLGVAEDITQRKQAVQQLIYAREKAEEAVRVKSDFLANMSHEIRTPMNGIIGMTELTLDTNLAFDQREYIETVKSSANSLLRIINDILDFSKIEAGKLELDPQPFQLRESIGDAIRTLAIRAHEKKLELLWHVPADVPDNLFGDVGRLRQVLVNLVGNAIKFTEAGEVSITVEADARTISNVRLRFSVRDTGIGIPADKQALVFEAFSQADSSATRTHGGTGLGLSISRQIVRLMGGEIIVESALGQGSTFHFTIELPLADEPVGAETEFSLEEIRVLVVDDNETNRRILDEVLRSWKMRPILVADAAAAIEVMRNAERENRPIPLVLTDCHMPHMDGFMFVEELSKYPGLSGATIMMLTSGELQGAYERCRQLGVAMTLLKPIKQSDLHRAIIAALGRAKSKAPNAHTSSAAGISQRPLRILLAEDNPINQRVAVRTLEKVGHTVQVAENGQAALDLLSARTFDVVLMDVQMPVLDGLKATAALRQREKTTGRHQPVIAMTAHAMAGDRERCLAAGMDDYVTKPIDLKTLLAALDRAVGSGHVITPPPSHVLPKKSTPSTNAYDNVCDLQSALARLDGDKDFLSQIGELFVSSTPEMLSSLESAVHDRNTEKIGNVVHALKGMVGNFCAEPAWDAAQSLEGACRAGDLSQIDQLHRDLLQEVERLSEALRNEFTELPHSGSMRLESHVASYS